ncbi:MAG: hypothetical protein IJM46_00055 [Oscillospiraceae bacterium]|nr:hypothetical protein [Oscillospiraceae bacterium]
MDKMKKYSCGAAVCLALLTGFCTLPQAASATRSVPQYDPNDWFQYDEPEEPELPDVLLRGDFNGDRSIDAADAQGVLNCYAEIIADNVPKITDAQRSAADINRDGEISADDAQWILQYYVTNTLAGQTAAWEQILYPNTPENAVFDDVRYCGIRLSVEKINVADYRVYWLDLSKHGDYVFDGDLLELELTVSKDAKNGIYPVEVYCADFSDFAANTDENGKLLQNMKQIHGGVYVTDKMPETAKAGSDVTLTTESLTAKPGETVKLHLRIDNNPGIAAFTLCFKFDGTALQLNRCTAGSALAAAASLTAESGTTSTASAAATTGTTAKTTSQTSAVTTGTTAKATSQTSAVTTSTTAKTTSQTSAVTTGTTAKATSQTSAVTTSTTAKAASQTSAVTTSTAAKTTSQI